MKYLGDSFSVHPGASKAYRDNWDKVFGRGKKEEAEVEIIEEGISTVPVKVTKKMPLEKKKRANKAGKVKNEKNKKSKKA